MQENYNFKLIEQQVQKRWQDEQTFKATDDCLGPTLNPEAKPKYYCLSMFSYPSGKLHMGHVRNYTIGDVIARSYRLKGYNVLQPFGWDAFGLPAENAALQSGLPPAKWTYKNIQYMKQQMQSLGFAIDWSREFATCDKEYYRFQQWLFIQLYNRGLIYRKTGVVNWDPVDMTVLANEQVIDGKGWRSGAPVTKKEIPMYYFKITSYADELLSGLDNLTAWPEEVKAMQRNWISKSVGVIIHFSVAESKEQLAIFTTRADTLFGVSYLAIAHDHPLAMQCAERNLAVNEYLLHCQKQNGSVAEANFATQEKTGVFSGLYATHPLTAELIPIWICNYVLMSYGTGAVMAVPAHDERDHAFARKYNLALKLVIKPVTGVMDDVNQAAYTEFGILCNSQEFDGLTSHEAITKITEILLAKNLAQYTTNYRLRDWGLSRQRYWGCPIPIIHCHSCGDVPVNFSDLPVILPEDLIPDGSGSPLAKSAEFYTTTCPKCHKAARRETDTMDTFVDSSWYYARFAAFNCKDVILDKNANYWLPVDQYIGGIEHAVLHLLYARFMHKCLRDLGLVSSDEPFMGLLTQGMVLANTYYREDETGKKTWFNPADIKLFPDETGNLSKAIYIGDGEPVVIGGLEKMSKSKNNGVDPQSIIDKYGADTVRLFMLFASPPELSLEWSDNALEGANRFIKRLWRMIYEHCVIRRTKLNISITDNVGAKASERVAELTHEQKKLQINLQRTIMKVSTDVFVRKQFNTAIASIMELLNNYAKVAFATKEGYMLAQNLLESVVIMLSIMIPHVCTVLWQELKPGSSLNDYAWVNADTEILNSDANYEMVIQVNGKLRGKLSIDTSTLNQDENAAQKQIEALALQNPNVQKFINGATIKKVVIVKNKLVNIVVTI